MRIELEAYDQDSEQIDSMLKNECPTWTPPNVLTKRKNLKSDCIEFMWGVLVISTRAKNNLTPLIGDNVEFFPLANKDQDLFIVKVNAVQDFVDMTNPVERKIGYGFFSDYVHIHPEKIDPSVHIFRLPQHARTRIYVSDEFKKTVEALKLKQFQFIRIWDTEYSESARNEKLKQYDQYYDGIAARETTSYQGALERLIQGKLVRNNNRMMKSEDGKLFIGEIFDNGTEQWIHPTYIPPLFMELTWIVYDTADDNQWIHEYFAELSREVNHAKGLAVQFTDKNLEKMVRRELQVYKDELTDLHLQKLRHVIPRYNDGIVRSLSGMKYASRLVEFLIKDNIELDPNELKHLPECLQSLSVKNCRLTDLMIMKQLILPHLDSLDIRDNQIADLEPLTAYQSLTWLNAENNRVEDVRCINSLSKLESLGIEHNPISNIHELSLPALRHLNIEGITCEDWSFLLEALPSLRVLFVSDETMTHASKKSLRKVIKAKKFEVHWRGTDRMHTTYNRSKT